MSCGRRRTRVKKRAALRASDFRLQDGQPGLQQRDAGEHGRRRDDSRAMNGKTDCAMSPFGIAEGRVSVHHLHERERNQDGNPENHNCFSQMFSLDLAGCSHAVLANEHSCLSRSKGRASRLDFSFFSGRCHSRESPGFESSNWRVFSQPALLCHRPSLQVVLSCDSVDLFSEVRRIARSHTKRARSQRSGTLRASRP